MIRNAILSNQTRPSPGLRRMFYMLPFSGKDTTGNFNFLPRLTLVHCPLDYNFCFSYRRFRLPRSRAILANFRCRYFGTNIAFCVVSIDWSAPLTTAMKELRNRTGILAVVNMVSPSRLGQVKPSPLLPQKSRDTFADTYLRCLYSSWLDATIS
jgi:hypothetical protein